MSKKPEPHPTTKKPASPPPEENEEQVEEDEEPEAEEPTGRSRTATLQHAQNRVSGLLERLLGHDEEGKRRVVRGIGALLGVDE